MAWSIGRGRVVRGMALGGVLLLGAQIVAGPALGAGADAKWAWATFRRGNADALLSQGTSAGSWNAGGASLHRVSTGDYQVTFYGVLSEGAEADIPFVTPIGGTARTCAVADWSPSGDSLVIEVLCQTLDGARVDSGIVVQWLSASGIGGRLGYGFNWSPTSNCTTPLEPYNGNGGGVRTCPVNDAAQMRFLYQGTNGGAALVTATDRDRVRSGSFPTSCTLRGWAGVLDEHNISDPNDNTFDERVDVRCWETDDVDNIYHEQLTLWMKGLGLKGVIRKGVAYAVVRKPAQATAYVPAKADRYSSSGGTVTVRRTTVGRTTVTFAGQPTGGAAQVTPITPLTADERRVCTVVTIGSKAAPATVKIACFDKDGAPADTRFVVAWTR